MIEKKYLRVARHILNLAKTASEQDDDLPDLSTDVMEISSDPAKMESKMPDDLLDEVSRAIKYITDNDTRFGDLCKQTSTVRAVYIMLKQGGFDLQKFHRERLLRHIIGLFI